MREKMVDLIDRQAAIDAMLLLEQEDIEAYGVKIPEGFDAEPAVKALKALPSALVRCRDCKHHEDESPGMVYCPDQVGGWVREDFFCADGERRDNG